MREKQDTFCFLDVVDSFQMNNTQNKNIQTRVCQVGGRKNLDYELHRYIFVYYFV
jgi:hypothetical protein